MKGAVLSDMLKGAVRRIKNFPRHFCISLFCFDDIAMHLRLVSMNTTSVWPKHHLKFRETISGHLQWCSALPGVIVALRFVLPQSIFKVQHGNNKLLFTTNYDSPISLCTYSVIESTFNGSMKTR